MSLFQLGDFKLASGVASGWKIDCDALTQKDWDTLAYMAASALPNFRAVYGVPRGGIPFADGSTEILQTRWSNIDRRRCSDDW